jgi:hypothetical protein
VKLCPTKNGSLSFVKKNVCCLSSVVHFISINKKPRLRPVNFCHVSFKKIVVLFHLCCMSCPKNIYQKNGQEQRAAKEQRARTGADGTCRRVAMAMSKGPRTPKGAKQLKRARAVLKWQWSPEGVRVTQKGDGHPEGRWPPRGDRYRMRRRKVRDL